MKIIGEYHDPEFYFQELVRRQVEREAWIDWANKPTPPLQVVPPLTKTKRWSEAALHAFYHAMRGAMVL
jgi:hypothetical protein